MFDPRETLLMLFIVSQHHAHVDFAIGYGIAETSTAIRVSRRESPCTELGAVTFGRGGEISCGAQALF